MDFFSDCIKHFKKCVLFQHTKVECHKPHNSTLTIIEILKAFLNSDTSNKM